MALPFYLAMTAAEITKTTPLPSRLAYMACHFSPYGPGLSNCPAHLPEGAILMLDDVTPIHGHDPERITEELKSLLDQTRAEAILLDFQQPGYPEAAGLAAHLVQALPCPVAVSSLYCENLNCPVLLPPVPPDVSLSEYLAPWKRRPIWLEAALDGLELLLTESGCQRTFLSSVSIPEDALQSKALHCHYTIRTDHDSASFMLCRTEEDLAALLEEAETLGVHRAVGLWQEFRPG